MVEEPTPYKAAGDADNCPECGLMYASRCRCMIGDKTCANGHTWHECAVHGLTTGSGHDTPDRGNGCTCETAPAKATEPKGVMTGTPESPCRHHEQQLASLDSLHKKADAIMDALGLNLGTESPPAKPQ